MSYSNIKTTKTNSDRVKSFDFENIKFGKTFTDHMFMADYIDGKWTNLEILPTQPMSIHPGNMTLHYGQALFEGMKATKAQDGTPLLYRLDKYLTRINASSKRLCMPELPAEVFLGGLRELVTLDQAWIPPQSGSALYVRPFMFAMDNHIGVRPSETYRFMIIALPAGPYYGRPVSLRVEPHYIRAAVGGVGEAKAAGNYAAAMYPTKLAHDAGYDQILWLDAKEHKYIQEVGTMNIFFVVGDKVITPATDGTILKGITRDSIITICKDKGIEVEERPISIDEIVEAHEKGELKECFGSGTAAVIAKVNKIGYKNMDYQLPDSFPVASMLKETIDGIRAGSIEDKFNWLEELPILTSV